MTYKFPTATIGLGAAATAIREGSVSSGVSSALNAGANSLVDGGVQALQGGLNKAINKVEKLTGLGLGRTSLDKVISDPTGAIADVIAGGGGANGLYAKLQARPDPLLEIDWDVVMPLGLKSEYVEEIQWSHPRFTASSGIFRNGSHIFMVEGMETSPLTLNLYEDRLMTATNWLYKWRSLVFDEKTNTYNYQATYKKDIQGMFKNSRGDVVGSVTFKGCFPTTLPPVNFTSDHSGRARLQIEVSCDSIKYEVLGGASILDKLKAGISNSLSDLAKGAFGNITNSVIARAGSEVAGKIGSLF